MKSHFRRTDVFAALAVFAGSLLIPSVADAAGFAAGRTVSSSSLRTCAGKLTEQHFGASNIHSTSLNYRLICTSGDNVEWVFAAAMSCGKRCGDGKRNRLVRAMMDNLSVLETGGGKYSLTFPAAALGKHCRRISYTRLNGRLGRAGGGESDTVTQLLCAEVETFVPERLGGTLTLSNSAYTESGSINTDDLYEGVLFPKFEWSID
jgi:hypothetical protein